ncbi:MAG TPA: ABC transporter permease, partial [Sandaracinaceae bacterium LLY-WYZ-13_1]|nr:ABC transporter permease [Sandaracinaceae bacterium LLY-WYZ-13_1]
MTPLLSVLDRKLLRNLGTLRGQVITIALVVGAGIATYVTLQGTWDSLIYSRDAYYERYRFAEVFARLKRAPDAVADRVGAVDGVAEVDTRVTEIVNLPFPDEPEPAAGQILSIPSDGSQPAMNQVALQSGRWPAPGRSDEILLLDNFAKARSISPGDELTVIVNGTRRDLSVTGTALSPEFVFAMEPGNAMPEPDGFAVIWMFEEAVAAAFQMEGAFNGLVLRLQPGASEAAVIDAVDRILEPYGGFGAVGRDLQESNYFLSEEIGQLEQLATMVPLIFLGVAAFLLNVVLSRLIHLQRSQIAALKALGYADLQIGMHFLKLVSVVVVIGAVLGIVTGWYLGRGLTDIYTQYFHFPVLRYRLDWRVAMLGIVISLAAAVIGSAIAVRQVVRLPPAEAMRPPAPDAMRLDLPAGVVGALDSPTRIILRSVL